MLPWLSVKAGEQSLVSNSRDGMLRRAAAPGLAAPGSSVIVLGKDN